MKLNSQLIAASLLSVCLTWPAFAKVEEYVIDKSHSKVGFEIAHLVISTVEGQFNEFSGSLFLNPDKLAESGKKPFVTATVDVNSIDTGIEKRDKHLRSNDFFDVKKYPKMTFTAKKISKLDDKEFELTGDLTIKDKTHPVTFEMEYKGSVTAYEVKRVAFEGEAKISRKKFGLTWNNVVEAGPVVGDKVKIELIVQAKRKADMS